MGKITPTQLAARIGTNVRHLRGAHGYTLAQLGTKCALHKSHLSTVENGHKLPSLAAVIAIAAALGVEPAALLREPIW